MGNARGLAPQCPWRREEGKAGGCGLPEQTSKWHSLQRAQRSLLPGCCCSRVTGPWTQGLLASIPCPILGFFQATRGPLRWLPLEAHAFGESTGAPGMTPTGGRSMGHCLK